MFMTSPWRRLAPLAALLGAEQLPSANAQGPLFQTPGQPLSQQAYGQTDRFSNIFNPAIAFVIDTVGDYVGNDGGGDGFDLDFRTFELNLAAWVDPSAWAYAAIVADTDEIELEEAAAIYQGFDSNLSLRAGRFFVDFGKQMQFHVHDLRTVDRPAVLAEYLGEELAGNGVQLDNWFTVGDQTVVRYSLGIFAELGGEDHGEDDHDGSEAEQLNQDRLDPDEFGLTARLTGFRDVGESGILQLGLSTSHTPDFDLELDDSGDKASNLSNTVVGTDLTYGWVDETGIKRWTLGGEALLFFGDTGADSNDNILIGDTSDDVVEVFDETVVGFFAFGDYMWSQFDSAGVQLNWLERPESGKPSTATYDIYYTHWLSNFQRLRMSVGFLDEEHGDNAFRAALQYTIQVGPHSHGVNF